MRVVAELLLSICDLAMEQGGRSLAGDGLGVEAVVADVMGKPCFPIALLAHSPLLDTSIVSILTVEADARPLFSG